MRGESGGGREKEEEGGSDVPSSLPSWGKKGIPPLQREEGSPLCVGSSFSLSEGSGF